MKYFTSITSESTKAQIKYAFKQLAIENHPDKGGSTEIFQEILNEYNSLMNGEINLNEEIKSYEDFLSRIDEKLMELYLKLCAIDFDFGMEICGTWIWITTTKENKDTFKELGFKWAKKKEMWFWHCDENKKRYGSKSLSMDKIRTNHGSTNLRKTSIKKVA